MAEDYEFVIAGCPCDESARKKIGLVAFLPPDGSIKCKCDTCGYDLWVGPRQQEKIKEVTSNGGTIGMMCFLCVSIRMEISKGHPELKPAIAHLGGEGGTYVSESDIT